MTRPTPPGPHHPHNCGCHHCHEWRRWLDRLRDEHGRLPDWTPDDALEAP